MLLEQEQGVVERGWLKVVLPKHRCLSSSVGNRWRQQPADRRGDYLAIEENSLPAHERAHHPALHFAANVRAVMMAIEEVAGLKHELLPEIDYCDVGVGANRQAAFARR
jgi:hypothetical protein